MRYTQSHEWIDVNGSIGTVGISDYAQRELGEVVYIQLPKVGQAVKAGSEVVVVESTKAAADIYAPVSGTIVAVNEALRASPASLNQQSETSSWLFKIELSDLKELDHLMSAAQYQQSVR